MDESIMRCPVVGCGKDLVAKDRDRYEDLSEHVFQVEPCLKTGYGCSDPECVAGKMNLRWISDGSLHCISKRGIKFVGDNEGAFNSNERQVNIEIYKSDENYIVLNTRWFYIKREFSYKSNLDGDILGKSSKLILCIYDEDGRSAYVYVPGLLMLLSNIKQFRRYKRDKNIEELKEMFELPSWEDRWWRVGFNKWITFWYKSLKENLNKGVCK